MRRYSLIALMFATVMVLILSGCQSSNQPDQVEVNKVQKELHTFYPGDITQVDSIEMMTGGDGTKKTTTDQVLIQEWIEKVRDLEIVIYPDQEDATGVLFHVTMFEQGEEVLYMTPTDMNHQRMQPQLELADRMSELYDAIE
ncbi:hypothetical protein CXK86_04515 [Paenibacillus sp. BGI2013]|uniref:hypothetical protein n=1 Tax=Paenibacillus TaxID=44249 RepID=UPI00096C080B|nr:MULTISPECIES: hypothetical protein [Paenibacillus]OMF43833.1 hypothetical protein BK136_13980 [Paenibacillus amylolyticus]PKQ91970.1 hypothetical protein CXK86_04515 [Paenibacillus sp. BGI2013]